MATINGTIDHSSDNPAHLGKRKRSISPEKKANVNGEDSSALQQRLRQKLQLLSNAKPVSSLLKQALPSPDTAPPDSKRPRLSVPPEGDTIEKRISSDFYTSIDQVRLDLSRLQDAIKAINSPAGANGEVKDVSITPTALHEATTKIEEILSLEDMKPKPSIHSTGQVITLRSQTEKGVQQLYSGLQIENPLTREIKRVDGRRLPNGFDLTDPATIDTNLLAPPKDRRTFGDVFRPPAGLKQLEMPRGSRSTFRSNVLTFSQETNVDRPQTTNRQDYKFQQLPVGSWLSYNLSDHQSDKRSRGRSLAQGDLRAALLANDLAAQDTDDASSLFKKAYSSFAPTFDTSKAVVSERDRDRHWWHKHGPRKLHNIFRPHSSEDDRIQDVDDAEEVTDQDFSAAVSNFQPEQNEDPPSLEPELPETVDDVLTEISSLLETLHSYHLIRSLETRPSLSTPKPSAAEFDSYEILRSQLSILISSLPPFAVAKLDGDKLSDLNISTNIIVDTIDYRGTGQPDDYTLSRYRATQPAPSVPVRPQAQPPRQTYPTPSVPRYNNSSSLSAYAQNLGVAAARYQGNYQTPNTMQRPFQASQYQTPTTNNSAGGYNAQAALQAFQRTAVHTPTQNGYGYNATTPGQTQQQPQPPSPATQTQPHVTQGFAQSPGFQQNAQNKISYGTNANANANAVTGVGVGVGSPGATAAGIRSPSPAKPVIGRAQGYLSQPQPQTQPQSQSPVQRPSQQQTQSLVNGTTS